MKILFLHNLENFRSARASTTDYVFFLERHWPGARILYHPITFPVTPVIKATTFDVVVMDSTALGVVTFRPRSLFEDVKRQWAFLRSVGAFKIVFPQDDYNHSALLDAWFSELAVDLICTPLPEWADLLYPRSRQTAKLFGVLTGYIEDALIENRRGLCKPFKSRSRLIGQRVSFYSPRGGRHAQVKGRTALMMRDAVRARGLVSDIVADERTIFTGEDWFKFLGDSKFVLGALGGVSIHDPTGEIMDKVEAYLASRPQARFEEVEAACFPGEDGRYVFSAVSPRLFEAALCGCCQILVEGEYLGLMKPYEHYIPMKADGSNLDEVFDLMADEEAAERRAAATYQLLVDNAEFRFSRLAARLKAILPWSPDPQPQPDADSFDALRPAHWQQTVEALIRRETTTGFQGVALIERVTDLVVSQSFEPETGDTCLLRAKLQLDIALKILAHERDERARLIASRDELLTRVQELNWVREAILSPDIRSRMARWLIEHAHRRTYNTSNASHH